MTGARLFKIVLFSTLTLILTARGLPKQTRIGDAVGNKDLVGLALFTLVEHTFFDNANNTLVFVIHEDDFFRTEKTGAFGKRVFNTIAYDRNSSEFGAAPWVNDIGRYEALYRTADLVLRQMYDLATRLDLLRENKERLIEKYDDSSVGQSFDKDIRYLSTLGWRLVKATRSFFEDAKKTMIKIDIAASRLSALNRLNSLNQDIEKINAMRLNAIDQNVKLVIEAMKTLEKAAND